MPLGEVSRRLLTASYLHLAAVGALLSAAPWDGVLDVRWDALLWLLLIGFVGFTTIGFALHLFPGFAQRPFPPRSTDRGTFLLAEGAVLLGAVTLGDVPGVAMPRWSLAVAAILYLLAVASIVVRFVGAVRIENLSRPPSGVRPADRLVVPLFLGSWSGAVAAGLLFLFAGITDGPGFGWWVAGIHAFLLGHVVLLILGSSLRLVPRSLGADPPLALAGFLAGAGGAGALLVPLGMLTVPPLAPEVLALLAVPEAAMAVGFLGLLFLLGLRARSPRSQLVLHAAGVAFLCGGGAIGLWMVAAPDFDLLTTHALVNLVGFVGLTILVMSFGMIAPFQRISHSWSKRMMWGLATLWIVAVALMALVEAAGLVPAPLGFSLLGAATFVVALLWMLGAVPVLYPSLNPLPGVPFERLQEIRKGRHER